VQDLCKSYQNKLQFIVWYLNRRI